MLNKLKRAALGAHTPHDKATAASKPVPMPLPAQVRILMSQHIGAPAKALVKKGDEVFVGTKIGEAGGFVSANIHSSVSGTVAAVEPFRLSNGRTCDSVVIKTDGKQTVDPAVQPPVVTDKASFMAAVRECGLVGLGGAGFPTDVKLQPKQQVDTLLINASECEVWLTSDTQEMLNCSDDIIRGIKAVLQYTGIPKCIIGIENNKPECIDLLCKKTQGDSTIEVKPLPSVYGTGAELILIEKCLGREVPHGGLPADAGAIVMNVTSVSTLGKYLATGMPVVIAAWILAYGAAGVGIFYGRMQIIRKWLARTVGMLFIAVGIYYWIIYFSLKNRSSMQYNRPLWPYRHKGRPDRVLPEPQRVRPRWPMPPAASFHRWRQPAAQGRRPSSPEHGF